MTSTNFSEIRTTHQFKRHPLLWAFLEKQRDLYWLPKHPDLSLDLNDIKRMPAEWSHFIKFLSAFFAISDKLVNVSIEERLKYFVDKYASKYKMELEYNWHFQEMMEDIHSEQYSLLLETYIVDAEEKQYYINCIQNFPTIKEKADFILSINEDKYQHNPLFILTACACVERIGFSASFAGVFWFKTQNMMPGLIEANTYIIRDEGIHCDILTTTINLLVEDDPSLMNEEVATEIQNIVKNACDIEKRFAREALPKNLPGMNYEFMCQYIEFIGDRLLDAVRVDTVYNVNNPFEFMNLIGMETKSSFFEVRGGEYRKADNGANANFVEVDDI